MHVSIPASLYEFVRTGFSVRSVISGAMSWIKCQGDDKKGPQITQKDTLC